METNRRTILEPFLKAMLSELLESYSLMNCEHIKASRSELGGHI